MKTAISISDKVFQLAEQKAEELGISRSELYTKALESYLKELKGQEITASLNAFYKDNDSQLDPVLAKMQSLSLGKSDW
jgi:metal-responsive CopG/Arc/MetJ family transcriptional regulator